MKSAAKLNAETVADIEFQPASLDIWKAKYRLTARDGAVIDTTIDETYQRVARALAEVEAEPLRDDCYKDFLWALRSGAIPAAGPASVPNISSVVSSEANAASSYTKAGSGSLLI